MLGAGLVAMARPFVVAQGGAVPMEAVMADVRGQLGLDGLDRFDGLDDLDDSRAAGLASLLEEALCEFDCPLQLLPDKTVVDRAEVGARQALSHRLTDAEVAAATLDLSPDLATIAEAAAFDGGLHLDDGTPLRRRDRRERGAGREGGVLLTAHLEGPAGWLDRFPAGGLVVARAAGGFLSLEAVKDHELFPPPDDLVAGLQQLYDLANEGGGTPVSDEALLLFAGVERPGWFERPTLPLGELVRLAGFEVDGRVVGRPGCWEAYRRLGELLATTARTMHLERDDSRLVADALDAFEAWKDDPASERRPGLEVRLRRQWPAAAALVDELRWRDADATALAGFGRALGGPVGSWLQARAAAIDGRTDEAETLVAEAVAVDGSFGPLVSEAAWYASDRGDARRAANLLHRVRSHDDDDLLAVRRIAGLLASSTGRNERCPCGSGRKFKQCHLGRPELPEADRVLWLLDKARTYLVNVAPPAVLADGVAAVDDGLGSHLIGMDLMLFDEGWLERFLAARGTLLPEVERAWLERWLNEHVTSVFRAGAVADDGRPVLEDVANGVRRRAEPSEALSVATPDRLVWCRLVPVEDRWRATGVARGVALAERESLLAALAPAADPATRREGLFPDPGPPRITNTSGDPMLLISTHFEVGVAAGVVAAFDDRLGRDGEELLWHTYMGTVTLAGAITATFRLRDGDGPRLVVETNSRRRRDEAVALVGELVPAARIVAEEPVPPARARALETDRRLAETAAEVLAGLDDDNEFDDDDELDDDDEELEAALAAIRARFDAGWIDSPIPALGGRTPREAAADDDARRDLRTLVAEMELIDGVPRTELRETLGL